ncbi:FAD-dependent oxidoreductase [Parasphingorhabdus pacifica]
MTIVETDVLVVGSGPAGASAALALSTYGVPNILITREEQLAGTPRAHITNQRTMEVLRDFGLEQAAAGQATPQHLMGNTTFCTTIAGEELGRIRTWGNDPITRANHELASPSRMCDLPQHLLEPILVNAAVARGTRLRFSTQYLSLEQDEEGVTATVVDKLRGDEYRIRAKYLIGADGARSSVAADAGLSMVGQMGVAGSINIVFEADLARYVEHRPSILYWVLQTGADVGGIGMGLVRCVRPWNEWLVTWGYDVEAGPPELTDEYAESVVRLLLGDDETPVDIKSASAWTVNHMHAESYSAGRVFCAGDAVHRHPPSNGLGSNTSIQDSYNLAWKLKLVLNGTASPALLDSYSDERVPVGEQVVDRANRSILDTSRIFDALGLLSTEDPEQMRENVAARKQSTPEAEKQRRALREAIDFKKYEFDAHGVELNHRYVSGAVVAGDSDRSQVFGDDPELRHVPTTTPGVKLPHAWLTENGRSVSTLDVGGGGRFALFTGPGGQAWLDAVSALAEAWGVPLVTALIGPGRRYEDPYGDWFRVKEITDSGCLLVRPDNHVCFRSARLADDPVARLESVFRSVLGWSAFPR